MNPHDQHLLAQQVLFVTEPGAEHNQVRIEQIVLALQTVESLSWPCPRHREDDLVTRIRVRFEQCKRVS